MDRNKAQKHNDNPGPGTYAADQVKILETTADKPNNAFISKVARFCPTAPGSGLTKNPTYVENPDPGAYCHTLKFQGYPKSTDAKRTLYGSKTHHDIVVVPKPSTVGIPSRKIAPKAYSGLAQDTVGPALYNPN